MIDDQCSPPIWKDLSFSMPRKVTGILRRALYGGEGSSSIAVRISMIAVRTKIRQKRDLPVRRKTQQANG
jgi:hypothetical protein